MFDLADKFPHLRNPTAEREEEGREEMSDPNKPTSSGQGYGVSSYSSFANLPPPRGKTKNNLVKGLFSSSSSLSGKK